MQTSRLTVENIESWVLALTKLAGVRPPLAESTKVAKLPNPHNSNYEALRSPDERPEPRQELAAKKYQNGQ